MPVLRSEMSLTAQAAAVFAVAMAGMAPFVWGGYGSDYDNGLVIQASRMIRLYGDYFASRLPGYPLQEYVYSLLPGPAPWAYHLVTVAFSALGAAIFFLLAKSLDAPAPALLTTCFALLPGFFVNSFTALDYNWSLALLLASLLACRSARPWVAGALLGLAAGVRLPNLAVGLPFLIAFSGFGRLWFAASAIAVAAAAFLPVYGAYGWSFLAIPSQPVSSPVRVIYGLGPEVWGELGALAILWLVIATWPRLAARFKNDPFRMAAGIAVLVNLAIFARAPYEGEYLLPAAAILLLLVGAFLSARSAIWLAGSFAFSLVVGVSKDLRPMGKLVEEMALRTARTEYARKLAAGRSSLPPNAVIITSIYQPLIELELAAPVASSIVQRGRFPERWMGFQRLLMRPELDRLRASGVPVFTVKELSRGDVGGMGYDPREVGVPILR
mgnify:CR=1 FL=1